MHLSGIWCRGNFPYVSLSQAQPCADVGCDEDHAVEMGGVCVYGKKPMPLIVTFVDLVCSQFGLCSIQS